MKKGIEKEKMIFLIKILTYLNRKAKVKVNNTNI